MSKRKPRFEELYYEYYAKVNSYIRNKINNRADAEDLTQESFEYCYRAYESFDPEKSSISTWLYLIVNSRVKNYYRDKKLNEDIDEYSNVLPAENSDMDRAIYLEQMKRALISAINKLPERQRRIIAMKFFLGKSHREIAQELEISETNSRVMLTRALKNIKDLMQDFDC